MSRNERKKKFLVTRDLRLVSNYTKCKSLKVVFLALVMILKFNSSAQTIYKRWYCDTAKTCFYFNDSSSSYDYMPNKTKIKFKKDQITISKHYRLFVNTKVILKIAKLTNDTLVLTQVKYKDGDEIFYFNELILVSCEKNQCGKCTTRKEL